MINNIIWLINSFVNSLNQLAIGSENPKNHLRVSGSDNDKYNTSSNDTDTGNESAVPFDIILPLGLVVIVGIAVAIVVFITRKCKKQEDDSIDDFLDTSMNRSMRLHKDQFLKPTFSSKLEKDLKELLIKPIKLHLPPPSTVTVPKMHEFLTSSTVPNYKATIRPPSPLIYLNLKNVNKEHLDFASNNYVYFPLLYPHYQMYFDVVQLQCLNI